VIEGLRASEIQEEKERMQEVEWNGRMRECEKESE
jgi:hypothetical protein